MVVSVSVAPTTRTCCEKVLLKVVTITPGYVDTALTRNNPYDMPFLMQPDDFADRAYRAIARILHQEAPR